MEIIDIIKESFIFPSKNLGKLGIYFILILIVGLITTGGMVTSIYALTQQHFPIVGIIAFTVTFIVGFIISGYQIHIMKSGIDSDEKAPSFEWENDLINGIKLLILGIVYMIIPAVILLIVGIATNIPGQFIDIMEKIALSPANATAIVSSSDYVLSTIPEATKAAFGTSIAITTIIGIVLLVIFSFLETMGEARLANTGSLLEAANVFEAFNDMKRIGIGKVIAVILLIVLISAVINAILGYLYGQIPQLSILSFLVSSYLVFFSQRAKGLLYSDIA